MAPKSRKAMLGKKTQSRSNSSVPAMMKEPDPFLSPTGLDALQKLKGSKLLAEVTLAFVSPLSRALFTALSSLPVTTKMVVTKDVAEIDTDKFHAKTGIPLDGKTKQPIEVKRGEQCGKTRRELNEQIKGWGFKRKIVWENIEEDEAWWRGEPETKAAAQSKIQQALAKVKKALADGEVPAVVGHSLWFKVAAPFELRPKSTPNPLGTAAHFWPKNSTPYAATIESDGKTLRPCRKLTDAKDIMVGEVVLLRHAHSEAQATRSAKRKEAKQRTRKNAENTSKKTLKKATQTLRKIKK